MVLDAQYEATIAAAAFWAMQKGKRLKVFLTQLGGGVFQNPHEWIKDAIIKNLKKYKEYPLDVYVVHYKQIDKRYMDILDKLNE